MSDIEPSERWVSVAEAAAALDKSDRTVRRMVADGRLTSRKEGARLFVNLADVLPASAGAASDVSSQDVTLASLRAEVDKLQALNRQVSNERDYLRGALAQAMRLAETKALEPPRERGWWQFWRSED
jgi:excisionase family DNA binding protein